MCRATSPRKTMSSSLGCFLRAVTSIASKRFARSAFVVGVSVVVVALIQAFSGALPLDRMRISGVDPVEYYVYLPSLFFDKNVDFFNEFFHFAPTRLNVQWVETATGHRRNPHGIGMAIAQAPFYIAAYLILAGKSGHFPLPISYKYDPLFEQAWYVGNIFWFAFATFLMAIWLSRACAVKHALSVSVFFFFATPMLYYTFPIVPMAHGVSLAAILLLLICVANFEKTARPRWCLLAGVCLGFAVSVRTTDFLFLAYLAPHLFLILRSRTQTAHSRDSQTWQRWLKAPGLVGLGLLLGFLPELIVLKKVFGRLIVNPYIGESVFVPANILKVAFSTKHGFITWHPILLIGLIGLFVAAVRKRRRSLAFSGILAVLGVWLLISTSRNWWGGWSFGHRVFIEAYPFFALGTGVLVDAALKSGAKSKRLVVLVVAVAAILWNILFMIQYKAGLIPREATLTFHQYLGQKLEILWAMVSGGSALLH